MLSTNSGYQHKHYIESYCDYGAPLFLEQANGYLLCRNIPNSTCQDAMGSYPFLTCSHWDKLEDDLTALETRLICAYFVTDPFASAHISKLKSDRINRYHFKNHHVIDLTRKGLAFSNHHVRYAKKSLKTLSIACVENPADYADVWCQLYRELILRHHIKGYLAFPDSVLTKQMAVPGAHLFVAKYGEEIVGAQVWYTDNNTAYYHLGATNPIGYAHHAGFGLMYFAIHYFAQNRLTHIGLGAGAGVSDNRPSSLEAFKSGWTETTLPVYFCSVIFQPDSYRALAQNCQTPDTPYFPAYRLGEFQ